MLLYRNTDVTHGNQNHQNRCTGKSPVYQHSSYPLHPEYAACCRSCGDPDIHKKPGSIDLFQPEMQDKRARKVQNQKDVQQKADSPESGTGIPVYRGGADAEKHQSHGKCA